MKDYQLIIRIPFEAFDDAESRQKAREMLNKLSPPKEAIIKLQRLVNGSTPERVPV